MRPGRRLIQLIFMALGISLLPLLAKWFFAVEENSLLQYGWMVFIGGLFSAALLDLRDLRRTAGKIEIERKLPSSLALGVWTPVELRIKHNWRHNGWISIFDHYPGEIEMEGLPQTVEIRRDEVSIVRYRVKATKRGDLVFNQVQLRYESGLKLWEKNELAGTTMTVKVYPNFAEIQKYILLSTEHHTAQLGIKRLPRRGEGTEFHQLREYRRGDALKHVDWKASARKRKLISREFQEETDQQIFFLLDCGRNMRAKDAHLSHFDQALNSMLLLSYIALRQGDAVGLMSFAAEKQLWIPPKKGPGHVNHLLNSVYDLHPTSNGADYRTVAENFLRRHRKRALVILVSNSRNENLDDLKEALRFLQKRHLVLFANLREEVLNQTVEAPIEGLNQALRYSGTVEYLRKRETSQEELTREGIISLDVTAKHLPIAMVNSYHELKRSGRI